VKTKIRVKIKVKTKIRVKIKEIRFFEIAWVILVKNNPNNTLILIEKSETIFKPFLNTIRTFYY
ncbi:hypothetical protein C2R77_07435, partial [Helicobacter pylori]|uniref:hypothetical protein n=1 Tax=Helicobacter pylori TaxID=210 RepID=UPI000D3A0D23